MGERATKNPAFDALPHEKNIPVNKTGCKFTRRWFEHRNQKTWSTFLLDKFSSKEPVNMIQIGVFEGMDLLWCLQNFLGHARSRVLAVDPWAATRKLDDEKMAAVEERARANLASYGKKVELVKGYSAEVLKQSLEQTERVKGKLIEPGQWDLVIVDGDHTDLAVLADARLALQLVRSGGWIVFDDVRNAHPKKNHVYDGLEIFLSQRGHEVKEVWRHRYCNCYEKLTTEEIESE